MIYFIRDILHTYLSLDIDNYFILTVLTAFYIAGIVLMALRIAITLGYQSYYSLFLLSAKEIKNLKELKETPSRLLNRTVKDYIRSAEKGVHGLSTQAIVNKHMGKLNLLFFRYRSIEDFVSQFEIAIILIGILLAAFLDFKDVFAVSAIALFCLMRLFGLVFNFKTVRENLETEMTVYIEREIGQHYTTNVATAIQMLKLEIKNIIQGQSKVLSEAISKLCADIPEVLKMSMPISEWSNTISQASDLQHTINSSIKELNTAAARLNEAMASFSKIFVSQNDYLIRYSESVHTEINELSKISDKLEPTYISIQDVLLYVKQNQAVLEKSLHSYELALEGITVNLGQGLGSIINYNTEAAYNNLNTSILENLNKVILSNNEFYVRLQKLFDEMSEQSRNETRAVITLKEQMDLRFDELKGRAL